MSATVEVQNSNQPKINDLKNNKNQSAILIKKSSKKLKNKIKKGPNEIPSLTSQIYKNKLFESCLKSTKVNRQLLTEFNKNNKKKKKTIFIAKSNKNKNIKINKPKIIDKKHNDYYTEQYREKVKYITYLQRKWRIHRRFLKAVLIQKVYRGFLSRKKMFIYLEQQTKYINGLYYLSLYIKIIQKKIQKNIFMKYIRFYRRKKQLKKVFSKYEGKYINILKHKFLLYKNISFKIKEKLSCLCPYIRKYIYKKIFSFFISNLKNFYFVPYNVPTNNKINPIKVSTNKKKGKEKISLLYSEQIKNVRNINPKKKRQISISDSSNLSVSIKEQNSTNLINSQPKVVTNFQTINKNIFSQSFIQVISTSKNIKNPNKKIYQNQLDFNSINKMNHLDFNLNDKKKKERLCKLLNTLFTKKKKNILLFILHAILPLGNHNSNNCLNHKKDVKISLDYNKTKSYKKMFFYTDFQKLFLKLCFKRSLINNLIKNINYSDSTKKYSSINKIMKLAIIKSLIQNKKNQSPKHKVFNFMKHIYQNSCGSRVANTPNIKQKLEFKNNIHINKSLECIKKPYDTFLPFNEKNEKNVPLTERNSTKNNNNKNLISVMTTPNSYRSMNNKPIKQSRNNQINYTKCSKLPLHGNGYSNNGNNYYNSVYINETDINKIFGKISNLKFSKK